MTTRRTFVLGLSTLVASEFTAKNVAAKAEPQSLEAQIGDQLLGEIDDICFALVKKGRLNLSPQVRRDLTTFAHSDSALIRVRLSTSADQRIAHLLVLGSEKFRGAHGRFTRLGGSDWEMEKLSAA